MNSLDRRDIRRAEKILSDAKKWPVVLTWDDVMPLIVAALKREREEAQDIAMNWFQVYPKNPKKRINIVKDVAKARRAIKRGAKVSA